MKDADGAGVLEAVQVLRSRGQFIQAAELLMGHVARFPHDAAAAMQLGLLLADLGFVGEARAELERSVSLDPEQQEAHRALEEIRCLLEGPPGPDYLLP